MNTVGKVVLAAMVVAVIIGMRAAPTGAEALGVLLGGLFLTPLVIGVLGGYDR